MRTSVWRHYVASYIFAEEGASALCASLFNPACACACTVNAKRVMSGTMRDIALDETRVDRPASTETEREVNCSESAHVATPRQNLKEGVRADHRLSAIMVVVCSGSRCVLCIYQFNALPNNTLHIV